MGFFKTIAVFKIFENRKSNRSENIFGGFSDPPLLPPQGGKNITLWQDFLRDEDGFNQIMGRSDFRVFRELFPLWHYFFITLLLLVTLHYYSSF